MNDTCYLCGSTRSRDVFVEHGVPLRRCLDCRHVYSGWEQDDHYDRYWDRGVTDTDLRFWDLDHRPVFEQFIGRFLTADTGTLVDVGCGLGFFVAAARRARPGWEVRGYEVSESAVAWAREHNSVDGALDGAICQGRVEDAGIPSGSVDAITLWDVIEHLPRPHQLLEHLGGLLKPEGFLFVQTPNWPLQYLRARLAVALDRGQTPGKPYLEAKDHVNQFSRASLARLAAQTGFAPPRFEVLKPIMAVGGNHNRLGVAAKVGVYHASGVLWRATGSRVLVNPSLFAFLHRA